MYNRRKFFFLIIVALSLTHCSLLFADNVGEAYNTEKQKQENNETTNNSNDELSKLKDEIKPEGSITDGLKESSGVIIDVMQGAMSQGMVTDKATIASVANSMGAFTRPLISILLGFFPGWILLQSILEFFGFIFKPAALVFGLDGSGSRSDSGSTMSGSSNQKRGKSFIKMLVSDEAISIYSGSGGSGGSTMSGESSMSGGSSNNTNGGKLKQWISYKIKWVITCVIVMIFICTPLGFNVICYLIACIINGATWLAGKLGV